MPRIFLRFAALCLLLTWYAPAQASLSATVDRQQLSIDETLLLTIEASGFKLAAPDLTGLEEDFTTLGTSQSSQSKWLNGKRSSITQWRIQLAPKRMGSLIIPPLSAGKETTSRIEITVTDQATERNGQDPVDISLEVTLADNTIYVGAQTQLTIKISVGTPANIQVDEPQHDDARIEQVNKVNYQKIRDGQQLRVTEYTYVLIPTRVGELSLEPLNLVAEVPVNQPRSLRRPFMGQSRRVIRRSAALTLNVIPPPENIDQTLWLPAKNVTLREQWSQEPNSLQVGDSVTRVIEFKAEGALASQLPPLFMPKIEGIKFYPDQPKISDSSNARGISGQRVEKIAMVATRAGRFELPELKVTWWDVASNKPMETRLPARVIQVNGAPLPAPTSSTSEAKAQTQAQAIVQRAWYQYSPWWWICGALLASLAVMALLYLRSQRQLTKQQRQTAAPVAQDLAGHSGEMAAYQHLLTTCEDSQDSDIYSALLAWARSYWGNSLGTLHDLQSVGANPQLVQQANALQQRLYGDQASANDFNSQSLRAAAIDQRAAKAAQPLTATLPPLYQSQ